MAYMQALLLVCMHSRRFVPESKDGGAVNPSLHAGDAARLQTASRTAWRQYSVVWDGVLPTVSSPRHLQS